MGFQVNGTTIIDSSRSFQSSAFPKVVNGASLVGSGDLAFKRAGVSSNHVVGDYILAAQQPATYVGGNTVAGSGFYYHSNGFCIYEAYSGLTSISLSGTWRFCMYGSYDTSSSNPTYQNLFYARIS